MMDELEMKKFIEESHAQMMKMSEPPKLIEKEEVDRNKSEWGNCNITVTPEVLEGLVTVQTFINTQLQIRKNCFS